MYVNSDGSVSLRMQDTDTSYEFGSASVLVTTGTWHHVAVTFGPDGARLYLDGVEVGSDPYTGGIDGNTEPFTLGASQSISDDNIANALQDHFDGQLDEFAVFDSQLTAASVSSLSTNGVGGGDGNDLIDGGAGNDTIDGGGGADTVDAGAGDDQVTLSGAAGTGGDLDGGADTDHLIVDDDGGVTVDLVNDGDVANATGTVTQSDGDTAAISNFEEITTGSGNDTIIMDNTPGVTVNSGAGNDSVQGRNADDVINAGSGDDTIYGDAGADTIDAGTGSDTIC